MIAAFLKFVTMFRTFGGLFSIFTGLCLRYTIFESNVSFTFFTPSVSSSSTSNINCLMKLSLTFANQIKILCQNESLYIYTVAMKTQLYLTLGRLKSDGTLCKQVICGLSGNFSKIRSLNGRVSLISALCSRNLSCFSFLMSSSSSKLSKITATNKLKTIYREYFRGRF